MKQSVSLITLGVADYRRARAFYEALGWSAALEVQETAFFQANGVVGVLWARDKLALDTGIADDGSRWGGITLAHNVGSRAEVHEVIEAARRSGAEITREPAGRPSTRGIRGRLPRPRRARVGGRAQSGLRPRRGGQRRPSAMAEPAELLVADAAAWRAYLEGTDARTVCGSCSRRRARRSRRGSPTARRSKRRSASAGSTGRSAAATRPPIGSGSPRAGRGASGRSATSRTSSGWSPRAGWRRPGWPRSRRRRRTAAGTGRLCRRGDDRGPSRACRGPRAGLEGERDVRDADEPEPVRDPAPGSHSRSAPRRGRGGSSSS